MLLLALCDTELWGCMMTYPLGPAACVCDCVCVCVCVRVCVCVIHEKMRKKFSTFYFLQ